MKTRYTAFALLIVAALALSACGQSATPEAMPVKAMAETAAPVADAVVKEKPAADAAMEEKPAADAMLEEKPAADAMLEEKPNSDAMMDDKPAVELPAWLTADLVDVNTGQAFAVADYQGKVVLVETLAVWCSNCLKQQKQVLALHEALGERNDFASLGIDIDLNESQDQLRSHAERNGFDWVYAVATPEVARQIGDLYGAQFLNPPATPMLIIDRQGQAHPLPFGIKSAADLQAALEPFLSEGM